MAAAKKGGLGKGLDSLIPEKPNIILENQDKNDIEKKDAIVVDIQKVEPNRSQPRKNFDEDSLLELADSIQQFGVLQPLIVQDKKSYYEIIAGERRWRAAKMAKLKEIPVLIKNYSDQEIVEISLIENIQREDLNPIEEAIAFKRLLDEFHLKQDEVAERVSKSRTAVTNSMRLLKLTDKVQQMVIDDMLTTGHARALIVIDDPERQYLAAQKIFDDKLSVRETERFVKKLLAEKEMESPKKAPIDPKMDILYQDLEEKMKHIFGTKVSINKKSDNKGKIEIDYYSQEELNRIIELFQTIKSI
jgi:ParB family chromosome partitioning protein